MANELVQHTFQSKAEAVLSLGNKIMEDLDNANEFSGYSTILLSGGSSPGPLYKYFNRNYLNFDKTTVGLVDERFVDQKSDFSNEKLVRSNLTNAVKIIGMVYDTDNYSSNILIARERNEIFRVRTDVVILGMGSDGHTASLFPNDPSSQQILLNDDADLFNTNAPSLPVRRITCSKKMLLNAQHIYLLIFGKEKLEILKNSSKELPIHTFLRERNDIEVYYAEN